MKVPRLVKLYNLDEEFELARMAVHGQVSRDVMEYKAEINDDYLYGIDFPPVKYDVNPFRKGRCIFVSAKESPAKPLTFLQTVEKITRRL